jgi:PAS domain S-box-containing protein
MTEQGDKPSLPAGRGEANPETGQAGGAPGTSLGTDLVAELFHGSRAVQTLIEALTEGLVVVDHSGRIILVNRRIEEMFGYSRDSLFGQSINVLLPERSRDIHTQHILDYFRYPRVRPMGRGLDLAAQRRDGTEFPVEISLSFLETPSTPLALAFVTDITLRKQAEMELRQRNEELDAFAHTVAHDLQSSLGILVGYSEFLVDTLETISPQELHRYLAHIGRNARKMSNIVAELLLLSSLDRASIVPNPVDTARIVSEVLHRLHYVVEESQAEIVLPDGYPDALGYAPWVEEVWYNYVSNAIKYGGRPPRIELGGTAEGDGKVRFWVSDNGQGLSPERQAQLFAPFTQLGQPQVKGQGLGLSIVKRIMDKLGGQVGVQSQVGVGSTFSFTLPGPG